MQHFSLFQRTDYTFYYMVILTTTYSRYSGKAKGYYQCVYQYLRSHTRCSLRAAQPPTASNPDPAEL